MLSYIMSTEPLKSNTYVAIFNGDTYGYREHVSGRLSNVLVMTLLALVFDMMSYSV